MVTKLTQFTLTNALLDLWRFSETRNEIARTAWHKVNTLTTDVLDGLREAIWALSNRITTITYNRDHDHNIPSFLE